MQDFNSQHHVIVCALVQTNMRNDFSKEKLFFVAPGSLWASE